MRKEIIFLCFFILLAAGCQPEKQQKVNSGNEENSMQKELLTLKEQLVEMQSQQKEFQSLLEAENNHNKERYDELWFRTVQMEHIVNHIPDLEVKLGYIQEIKSHDDKKTLLVQLVDMKEDNTSPNNYKIEPRKIAEIPLSDEISIYILNGVFPAVSIPLEELQAKMRDYNRLFHFHIMNGETIMLTEKYLP